MKLTFQHYNICFKLGPDQIAAVVILIYIGADPGFQARGCGSALKKMAHFV